MFSTSKEHHYSPQFLNRWHFTFIVCLSQANTWALWGSNLEQHENNYDDQLTSNFNCNANLCILSSSCCCSWSSNVWISICVMQNLHWPKMKTSFCSIEWCQCFTFEVSLNFEGVHWLSSHLIKSCEIKCCRDKGHFLTTWLWILMGRVCFWWGKILITECINLFH